MPNETRADDPVYYREGQGESFGPSFLSQFNPIADAVSRAALRPIDRPIYDSQTRFEIQRGAGAGLERMGLTFADVERAFSDVNSSRETTRKRGEQMRFSGQPDPLTTMERAVLDTFYVKVLNEGFAQWPLGKDRVILFLDGTCRRINPSTNWGLNYEFIYIGCVKDEGEGEFANPVARLAFITALMGITGHASKPELIELLSERLAKVMVGVYETVVKPLASTSDSRPIRRMAWSSGGGLATWLDGAWVGMTGEPVAVGPDWIVVDTGEGLVEEGLPEVGAVGATFNSVSSVEPIPLTHPEWVAIKDRFDDWALSYFTTRTSDGRVAVRFSESRSDLEARIVRNGLTGCVVELTDEGLAVITYPLQPSSDEQLF